MSTEFKADVLGAFETWAPTNQLMWRSKEMREELKGTGGLQLTGFKQVLMQLWFSDRGANEWREVPREDGVSNG